MKKTSILTGILISLIGIVSAHVGEDDYSHHMMMGSWGYGMFGMNWLGWIVSLLIISILVLLIILIIKKIQESEKKR